MPLVNKTFDQLLDFTRTSAATFVNSEGNIQTTVASRNLMLYTQEFDNAAWLKINTTVTANSTVAPDGTSTADTLTAAASTGSHYIRRQIATVTASTAYAFSFYVKAGTHDFIQLMNTGDAQAFANFDLGNGVVGGLGSKSTSSITSAGNGWYRCTVVFDDTAALSNEFRTYIVSSASAAYSQGWTTAGTETVFIWGAQVEVGSAATAYTRNNGGVFPPRFDYDPVTLAPKGLLIEEQRTNLLLRSEEFNTAPWVRAAQGTATAPVLTADNAIAPDGTMTATLGVFDRGAGTSADRSTLTQTVSVSAGTYTQSIWLKAATSGDVGKQIAIRNVGGNTYLVITLTATWERYTKTEVQVTSVYEITNRQGITADTTVSVLIYGAQLEAGAFATSYIPTVASQVTRTADVCSIVAPNFAPWYNQSEGTFVAEVDTAKPTTAAITCVITSADDGSSANRLMVRYLTANIEALNVVGTTIETQLQKTYSTNSIDKAAFAYAANNFAFTTNGATVLTDATGSVPAVNRLSIGNTVSVGQLNGHIRSIRYFPTRLSNAQLQALTV